MKVLVLSAGGTVGSRAAIELFRSGEVAELKVTARTREDAVALASRFSSKSSTAVSAEGIDVLGPSLSEHLAGVDVVVNCAGPGYQLELVAARAAIQAGVDYVSLCDDHTGTDDALQLDEEARSAGVTVVPGCGLSPGMTNYLAEVAATELDKAEEVQIALAASSADSDGFAAAQHLAFSLSGEAPFVSDGARSTEKAGTAPKLVYFPEPVGWVETFVCGHPEISTMTKAHPSLGAIQFRIGLTERVVMDVIRGSRAAGLLRTEPLRKAWLAATWPTRGLVERIPPRGAAWTAARVDIHGTQNGTASTISLGVVDHLVNLASTSIKEAALALGRGEARSKGVRGPEEVFDAGDMLARLARRGIRAARLESELV